MEDSDIHNLRKEMLHQQYELVKRSTSNSPMGTHCCHPPKLLISAMLILSISRISIARHLMSWLGRLKLKSRYKDEPSIMKYIKIAATLPDKTRKLSGSAFLIPYMAIRLNEADADSRPSKLSRLGSVMTNGAAVVELIGGAVCVFSAIWVLYGRMDGEFVNITDSWQFLMKFKEQLKLLASVSCAYFWRKR
ncbi:hypothetical protein GOBAR_DD01822 [Gossypium barbadense]|nr:hypothetical protein GOBAR_DD01822 [Gossypium barbadense]